MINKKTPPCYTVLDENDNAIHIEFAKRKTIYHCPDCKNIMIPKMGEILAHHFAHKPNEDGSEVHCGGEGFRHFRVKTFTHKMLTSISRHKFAYDLRFEMEKAHGEDIPDISVIKENYNQQKDNLDILAIEIVDTHPPSDEKRNRWGKNMLEIKITDWTDETIGNAAKLSGSLIPYLIGFEQLISSIELEKIKSNKAIETIKRERIKRILRLEEKEEKEFEKILKSSKTSNQHRLIESIYPNVWFANWTPIPESERIYESDIGYNEKIKKSSWGVSIKSYDGKEPKSGDWVWIKSKKGIWQHGLLGTCFEEIEWYNDDFELTFIFKHHLIGKPQKEPEFNSLLQNYKIMDQL